MKTGLPPQHVPDSMEAKRLHLLCRLYGEVPPNGIDPESDPELAAEWQVWQEVKAWLEARPRSRPDPAVVDRIVAAAARAARAADRSARPRHSSWHTRKTLAIVLTVSMGLVGLFAYALRPVPATRTGRILAEQAATTPQAIELPMAKMLQPATPHAAIAATAPRTSQTPPLFLEWDDREAVQQVYRQLQLLEARSAPDAWEPALPLEAWPTRQAAPGLLPASRRMP